MTFWFAIIPLIAFAVIYVLWPLIQGGEGQNKLAHAVAFYEARKAELLRQRDAGEISDAECEGAIAEQARNLLVLGRSEKAGKSGDGARAIRRRKLAALAMLIGFPALSLGLYMKIGAPGAPDLPLASREMAPQNFDLVTALQKIEAHLARNPNDGRGFEVVAPVYLKAGRYQDAAHAYRRVVELLGETPERLADLGESLVADQNGMVSADARQAFERAAVLQSDFAKARFYLALAREQDGDAVGALTELRRIVAALPEGPARMRVMAEIERFQKEGKGEPSGPGSATGKTIAGLPEADRDAAIRGMVDALDARLAASGGTLDEWRRLIQARLVLNQRDQAEATLAKARTALANDATAIAELDALVAKIKADPAIKAP
jgi:cytochrome c-type biogenesis protein CcmH